MDLGPYFCHFLAAHVKNYLVFTLYFTFCLLLLFVFFNFIFIFTYFILQHNQVGILCSFSGLFD